ncbi:MAG: glycoside hydrolase family 3 C-terminal domain-containing protein [Dysgonamonadaceae bacterium]|jgi:beta-glucosidase|nr:glycoside hydrolase family 3 C-terminal domain-containing protein [Dysgonamonadaceae bacterium]
MKKTFVWMITSVFCFFGTGCNKTSYEFPFQNPDLSYEERAADIVSRLTLEEKVAQMLNDAPAIDSLGIPPYNWWNECLHGVARTEYKVTVFPQAIGMAAGWDEEAMRKAGDYTATEGRAIYNISSAKGDYRIYHGLTYWTPNINIFRDPRWGRGQETYGEDPFLTSVLADNFVRGLQGNDPRYLKAAACAKHFAVHSGPEHNRHTFDVSVSNYDLWDTYLPAFKKLAETGVAGFMCAYNAFEGQPCCGSDKLLIDILRNDWGFTGYVTSDCGAINDFYNNHKTHPNAASAAADAVFHGTDVDCGNEAYFGLIQAVKDGLITEKQIDVALKRLFTIRLRLGLFDPPAMVPYSGIDSSALETPEHKNLALKMSRQSIVMLRNDKGVLPVSKENIKKIALIGPNVNDPEVQLGNYNGFPSRIITLLDGIRDEVGENVEIYCDTVIGCYGESTKSFANVVKNVKDADLIIYAGGISPRIEGEEMPVSVKGFDRGDRTSVVLPEIQTKLLKTLKLTGKPVVFVMMTGSAISIEWESQNIPAILNVWYGGEFAGKAIADVIFGNYNPSGRLPVTFYAKDSDLPDFENYDMSNRTYRYFKGKVLYPFGYGLSFSNFEYEWLNRSKEFYAATDTIYCSVKIRNAGKFAGDEVAQVYVKYPEGKNYPLKELRNFHRISLNENETSEVKISIPVSDFLKWDNETDQKSVPQGVYSIYIGGNSQKEALTAEFEVRY